LHSDKIVTWRLLELEFPDASANLALEEALARQIGERVSPQTLRLWRNRKAAVIGENQSVKLELQLDACRELGVEVVRRFTGGGAVYHDLGNLNYSICVPRPYPSDLEFQQKTIRDALGCAGQCLRILGIESSQVPINTFVVDGRKISGGAGAIRWGSVFYHGSILVSTDLPTVWKVLTRQEPAAPPRFVQSKRFPVTSIQNELGGEVSIETARAALRKAFTETFNATLVLQPATDRELKAASAMVKEKYGTEEWNLRM